MRGLHNNELCVEFGKQKFFFGDYLYSSVVTSEILHVFKERENVVFPPNPILMSRRS